MHEHSITNEVVHQIIHACEDNDIKHPRRIVVELGLLTTYKKDPVLFYFEAHKKDLKILKDAKLEIIEVPGRIRCNSCKEESAVEPSPIILCPNCSSLDIEVTGGEKIIIRSIE